MQSGSAPSRRCERPRWRCGSGEVHGLMGANGAGKSTLVKIVTGVYPATSGRIHLKGSACAFRSPREARNGGIVSVYQDPVLVPDLTVAENMRLAGAPAAVVARWLGELGVARLDFDELIRDLPYPLLRLIDLARALASEPAVLLLDEVTASLPADLSEQIYAMARKWRDRGNAVIFISHRMAEVSAPCDRATLGRGAYRGCCDWPRQWTDHRLFPGSGHRGHPDLRVHLGRRRPADSRKTGGRRAARVPEPRRRRDVLVLGPNTLILLFVSVAIIWIPLRRSRLGLQIYAIGSDRNAAFRSGVNVERTRIAAYVVSGLFSAVGGLALTMTTGIGAPLAGVYYTLSGIAPVVVGGVSLAGGRGGILGPVLAAFVLTLIPADLIFLNIDPNFGQVIQGTLIVAIVMIGGFMSMARERK
ncbi:MAG TPA: ATP-binding cassette domain-containing protein [Roseiarcus sp.]|nr:ATP-binding cassette domain-containing protein [Roseiarcus sp.]